MPINQEATHFERRNRWADLLRPGDPVTRAALDAESDDLADGIVAAYQAARRKAISLSALPLVGNEFERVVTMNPDGGMSLREWRTSEWREVATISASGVHSRIEDGAGSRLVVGEGNTVAITVLSDADPANSRAYRVLVLNPAATAWATAIVIRPVAGGAGTLIGQANANGSLAFDGGQLQFTPTASGDDNFTVLVERLA